MGKKFWISGIVAAVVMMALGFFVHGFILANDYNALVLGKLMRSPDDEAAFLPYMIVAHLFMGFAAAWIYRQGMTAGASWLTQGVRFGIAMAAVMTVPMFLIHYAVYPHPGMLIVKQIVGDSICWIVAGIVLAFFNKE
jgi:phosphoglycerol transferase MdoB-like AlkP superfamily enzyme